MKIQTFHEAKFAMFNYLGLGNRTNTPIIIYGTGCNGKTTLINDREVKDKINRFGYNVLEKGDYNIGDKLIEIYNESNKRYILTIKHMSDIDKFLLEFKHFYLIDMDDLYCGLPKTMFPIKYVEAFNENVIDYTFNGENIQNILRDKFNNKNDLNDDVNGNDNDNENA